MQTCQPPVLVVTTTDGRPKYLVDLMDILTWSDFRPKLVKCKNVCKAISIALNTLKPKCMYKSIDCTTYSTYIPSLNIKLKYILFIYRQWSDIWGHDLRCVVWSPWKPCQQVDRSNIFLYMTEPHAFLDAELYVPCALPWCWIVRTLWS
jgi:hypothetical protein